MKKLLTIILTIGLLISMTACGSETKKDNDTAIAAGEVVIDELTGKTLADIIDSGYKFTGYMTINDTIQLNLQSYTTDSNIDELKKSIEDMTVSELINAYDVSIGYTGFNGEYIFSTNIGSVSFSFDLVNGVKALEAHEDEMFYDLEEAEEIQNDKLENLSIEYITLTVDLDKASNDKLIELDDLNTDIVEEMAKDIVCSKVYYTTE